MPAEIVFPADLTDGVPIPQRYWAILTIGMGLTLAVLDGAIANVALPTIATDLHTSPSNSIWVINAYQLAVTISLLPLASLGDIFGYRRVYQAGFIVFTIASLACAMSWSLPSLAIARVFQGFGAAGIMSVNSALIRFIYPRRWIGRGVGINATIGSIASAAGPSVAAAILAVAPWPWLFAVNVPLGVVGAFIAWRALPATPSSGIKFDVASALMSALSLGLLITVIDGVGHGEHIELIAIQAMAAFVIGLILVARELSQTAPLLPVDLMRIPLFALSVTTSVCAFVAQAMALVSLPFLFENTLGFNQVHTGLLMTPWPLVVAVIAPFTGRLADRYPVGILSGVGLTVMALGLAALSLVPAHPTGFDIAWRMVVCGLGFGFFNTPNNRAIITSAPRQRTGGASGMQAAARLFGQTTGAALVALVFGLAPLNGTTVTLICGACISIAAAGVSLLRMIER
jgi:DHA2 family multidrug resistance protein-like MFS transporter